MAVICTLLLNAFRTNKLNLILHFYAIRQQKPNIPTTTMANIGSGLDATVISTSLQPTQQKAMSRATAQTINPTAAATITGLFENLSQAQGQVQLPQSLS